MATTGSRPLAVCYLAHARFPTEKAHGAQIVKTCEAFADAGAAVTLLVPGRKTGIAEDAFDYYGAKRNFALVSLATPDFVRFGPLGFALSLLLFSEAARAHPSFFRADVVYSRDAFVLLQYVLLGRKLVYEAHTRPTVLSRFLARRAHRVIVISGGLRDAYRAAGVRPDRIVVAHDAIDPEPFRVSPDGAAVRAELGIPSGKRIALYVGKVDAAKGVPTFAAASEYLPDDVLAVIIGEGDEKPALLKTHPKALFLPGTPYRDLPRVLAAADALVLPNSELDEDASRYTSPLKAFAYLASKKPIAASDVPALREILEGAAEFAAPDDPTALAAAITRALEAPPRPPADDHSWAARAGTILSAL